MSLSGRYDCTAVIPCPFTFQGFSVAVEVVWTIVIPLDTLGVHKVLAPCGVVRFVLAMSPLKQFVFFVYVPDLEAFVFCP